MHREGDVVVELRALPVGEAVRVPAAALVTAVDKVEGAREGRVVVRLAEPFEGDVDEHPEPLPVVRADEHVVDPFEPALDVASGAGVERRPQVFRGEGEGEGERGGLDDELRAVGDGPPVLGVVGVGAGGEAARDVGQVDVGPPRREGREPPESPREALELGGGVRVVRAEGAEADARASGADVRGEGTREVEDGRVEVVTGDERVGGEGRGHGWSSGRGRAGVAGLPDAGITLHPGQVTVAVPSGDRRPGHHWCPAAALDTPLMEVYGGFNDKPGAGDTCALC